jgi:hypothetical protein
MATPAVAAAVAVPSSASNIDMIMAPATSWDMTISREQPSKDAFLCPVLLGSGRHEDVGDIVYSKKDQGEYARVYPAINPKLPSVVISALAGNNRPLYPVRFSRLNVDGVANAMKVLTKKVRELKGVSGANMKLPKNSYHDPDQHILGPIINQSEAIEFARTAIVDYVPAEGGAVDFATYHIRDEKCASPCDIWTESGTSCRNLASVVARFQLLAPKIGESSWSEFKEAKDDPIRAGLVQLIDSVIAQSWLVLNRRYLKYQPSHAGERPYSHNNPQFLVLLYPRLDLTRNPLISPLKRSQLPRTPKSKEAKEKKTKAKEDTKTELEVDLYQKALALAIDGKAAYPSNILEYHKDMRTAATKMSLVDYTFVAWAQIERDPRFSAVVKGFNATRYCDMTRSTESIASLELRHQINNITIRDAGTGKQTDIDIGNSILQTYRGLATSNKAPWYFSTKEVTDTENRTDKRSKRVDQRLSFGARGLSNSRVWDLAVPHYYTHSMHSPRSPLFTLYSTEGELSAVNSLSFWKQVGCHMTMTARESIARAATSAFGDKSSIELDTDRSSKVYPWDKIIQDKSPLCTDRYSYGEPDTDPNYTFTPPKIMLPLDLSAHPLALNERGLESLTSSLVFDYTHDQLDAYMATGKQSDLYESFRTGVFKSGVENRYRYPVCTWPADPSESRKRIAEGWCQIRCKEPFGMKAPSIHIEFARKGFPFNAPFVPKPVNYYALFQLWRALSCVLLNEKDVVEILFTMCFEKVMKDHDAVRTTTKTKATKDENATSESIKAAVARIPSPILFRVIDDFVEQCQAAAQEACRRNVIITWNQMCDMGYEPAVKAVVAYIKSWDRESPVSLACVSPGSALLTDEVADRQIKFCIDRKTRPVVVTFNGVVPSLDQMCLFKQHWRRAILTCTIDETEFKNCFGSGGSTSESNWSIIGDWPTACPPHTFLERVCGHSLRTLWMPFAATIARLCTPPAIKYGVKGESYTWAGIVKLGNSNPFAALYSLAGRGLDEYLDRLLMPTHRPEVQRLMEDCSQLNWNGDEKSVTLARLFTVRAREHLHTETRTPMHTDLFLQWMQSLETIGNTIPQHSTTTTTTAVVETAAETGGGTTIRLGSQMSTTMDSLSCRSHVYTALHKRLMNTELFFVTQTVLRHVVSLWMTHVSLEWEPVLVSVMKQLFVEVESDILAERLQEELSVFGADGSEYSQVCAVMTASQTKIEWKKARAERKAGKREHRLHQRTLPAPPPPPPSSPARPQPQPQQKRIEPLPIEVKIPDDMDVVRVVKAGEPVVIRNPAPPPSLTKLLTSVAPSPPTQSKVGTKRASAPVILSDDDDDNTTVAADETKEEKKTTKPVELGDAKRGGGGENGTTKRPKTATSAAKKEPKTTEDDSVNATMEPEPETKKPNLTAENKAKAEAIQKEKKQQRDEAAAAAEKRAKETKAMAIEKRHQEEEEKKRLEDEQAKQLEALAAAAAAADKAKKDAFEAKQKKEAFEARREAKEAEIKERIRAQEEKTKLRKAEANRKAAELDKEEKEAAAIAFKLAEEAARAVAAATKRKLEQKKQQDEADRKAQEEDEKALKREMADDDDDGGDNGEKWAGSFPVPTTLTIKKEHTAPFHVTGVDE